MVLFWAQLIPVILCLRILPITGVIIPGPVGGNLIDEVVRILQGWVSYSCPAVGRCCLLALTLSAQARVASNIPRFIKKALVFLNETKITISPDLASQNSALYPLTCRSAMHTQHRNGTTQNCCSPRCVGIMWHGTLPWAWYTDTLVKQFNKLFIFH